MLPDRLLHHTPGACSRVALNALEEIGLPYREQSVALMTGAQYRPEFLAVNAKSKVPVLIDNGVTVTELPVVLYHLALAEPRARLLPAAADGKPALDCLSDLVWLAGTLHPTAARLLRPTALSAIDPEGVKAIATAQLEVHAARICGRLATRAWWYGSDWSITDMLLAWVYATAGQYGFSYAAFEPLAAHRARVEARPSFIRARACELAVAERDGLSLPPGFTL